MRALTFNITPASWVRTKLAARLVGRRAYWGRLSGLRLAELPEPELPGEGWVRCRTRLGGICGSDLAMLLLRHAPDSVLQAFSSMPLVPGHENVAQVEAVHPSVDASWVARRVCVEPTLCCAARGVSPACPACRRGQFNVCEHFAPAQAGPFALPAGTSTGYNARTGGSWGQCFLAHQSQLVPVPEPLSDEQALLTDPLACSLHAVLRSRWSEAQHVCVHGAGILGLGVVAALRATGFAGVIDVSARYAFQGELARRLGADQTAPPGDVLDWAARRTGGRLVPARLGARMLVGGYDVVFDCAGSVSDCLKLARAGGQVVLLATAGPGRMDPTPVWFQEVDLVGAYGRSMEDWQGRRMSTYALVHEWMQAGLLPTDGLLSHTFALADYARAFAVATGRRRHQAVKVALDLR